MDHPLTAASPMKAPPEPGPGPIAQPADIIGFRKPYIGQPVHFFPHKGHHDEWHYGPHAAIVIRIHPNDPRIVHLFYFGPKGEVGSYESIPHRSLRPDCYPTDNWLGRCMPTSTHWAYPEEMP